MKTVIHFFSNRALALIRYCSSIFISIANSTVIGIVVSTFNNDCSMGSRYSKDSLYTGMAIR